MSKKQTKKQAKKKPIHHAHSEEEEQKVAPQTRGLIDGSLNNVQILSHSNVAGVITQSKIDASKK